MEDIKVVDTMCTIQADATRRKMNENLPFHPLAIFAASVEMTRQEATAVSIEDIAKCFRAQFEEEELMALIYQLGKKKI